MYRQNFSFICQKPWELQPYKFVAAEKLICIARIGNEQGNQSAAAYRFCRHCMGVSKEINLKYVIATALLLL